MRSIPMFVGAGIIVLMAYGPAFADDTPDCSTLATQMDMNNCADEDYQQADAQLNAQYKRTRAAMQQLDANLDEDTRGAEKALIAGQRAWIAYRDGECEAEGFQVRGGSMEPMMVSSCSATLTRLRTKELKELGDGTGN